MSTNTPWAFGGLFGVAYGLLFIAIGVVAVTISQIIDGRAAKYFFGELASVLGIGALWGLAGAIIGVTVGFWGWEVSGVVCGTILGLVALIAIIVLIAAVSQFPFANGAKPLMTGRITLRNMRAN